MRRREKWIKDAAKEIAEWPLGVPMDATCAAEIIERHAPKGHAALLKALEDCQRTMAYARFHTEPDQAAEISRQELARLLKVARAAIAKATPSSE